MPHIHDKIDFAVDVLIVHKGRVLIRKHDKYKLWLAVGGHIELDEDPNEAALREVKEEVGLDVTLLDTRIFKEDKDGRKELIAPIGLHRHGISDTHEHISLFYVATSKTDEVIPEKSDDEWLWCSEEDIDKLVGITDNVAFYAKLALKMVLEYENKKH